MAELGLRGAGDPGDGRPPFRPAAGRINGVGRDEVGELAGGQRPQAQHAGALDRPAAQHEQRPAQTLLEVAGDRSGQDQEHRALQHHPPGTGAEPRAQAQRYRREAHDHRVEQRNIGRDGAHGRRDRHAQAGQYHGRQPPAAQSLEAAEPHREGSAGRRQRHARLAQHQAGHQDQHDRRHAVQRRQRLPDMPLLGHQGVDRLPRHDLGRHRPPAPRFRPGHHVLGPGGN